MGRIWTVEQREKQAERIRIGKPWLKSTGPNTPHGKACSSRNAVRHGCYGTEFKTILLFLRKQRHYIETLRLCVKLGFELPPVPTYLEEMISGNELNEPRTNHHKNDTSRHTNIIIFPQQKTRPNGRVFQNFRGQSKETIQKQLRQPFS